MNMTNFNYNNVKLNRHQIKVVLDFMGIGFKSQGSSGPEAKARLSLAKQDNNEAFERAIDIVVRRLAPEPVAIRSETFYHEWSELCDSMFDEKKDNGIIALDHKSEDGVKAINEHTQAVCDALDNKGTEMWRTLDAEVRKEIEKAREEFKLIAVKVGDSEPVVIEGLLHERFERIVQLAQQRKNIMLVGPAGCGKSHICEQVAASLKYTTGERKGQPLDFSSQSCTEGMSESMLSGWLLPIGETGQFIYVRSEWVRLYEEGGVFLLDEIDAADPNVLVFINTAIANGYFTLPQRHENPRVTKHADFVCIAAANTFGNGADAVYHGRNALDGSTLDRFRIGMIAMGYSAEIEAKLVDPEVLRWGLRIREAIDTHKLRRIMSTRLLRDATDMVKCQDWTMEEVKETYFSDWTEEDKRMVGER